MNNIQITGTAVGPRSMEERRSYDRAWFTVGHNISQVTLYFDSNGYQITKYYAKDNSND